MENEKIIIFIWTKKAEERAKELNLEERKEGKIAHIAFEKFIYPQKTPPKLWIEKGYVKEIEILKKEFIIYDVDIYKLVFNSIKA